MAPPSQSNSQQPPNATTKADVVITAPPKLVKSRDHEMPSADELLRIAGKAIQTGAVTGGVGMLMGAGSGIIRSAPPTLFAVVAGLQWFALGSSYTASKRLLWHAWGGEENLNSSDLVKASGVAGGVSGLTGGILRGPRNVLPGVLIFGTLGAGSSYLSQQFKSSESSPRSSWLDSKWSPMKKLSDKEYKEKIEDKILRLDAEIAILDESIATLKSSEQMPLGSAHGNTSPSGK